MMVMDLPPGDSRHFELGEAEAAVVPLQGSCQVEVGSTRFRLQGRPDVFSALTDLCFAPKGSVITISSKEGGRFCGTSDMSGEWGIRRLWGRVLHNSGVETIHVREEDPVETDGRRMCELLVGLGEVDLVGVEELGGDRLRLTIRTRSARPRCGVCGGGVWSKGERPVRLVDLPSFGRPVRLWWRKRRWTCPDSVCDSELLCQIWAGFGGWRWVQMRSEIRLLRTRMASLWVLPRVMSFW